MSLGGSSRAREDSELRPSPLLMEIIAMRSLRRLTLVSTSVRSTRVLRFRVEFDVSETRTAFSSEATGRRVATPVRRHRALKIVHGFFQQHSGEAKGRDLSFYEQAYIRLRFGALATGQPTKKRRWVSAIGSWRLGGETQGPEPPVGPRSGQTSSGDQPNLA